MLHTRCKRGKKHEFDFSWEFDKHRDAVTNADKDKWCFAIIEDDELFQFDIVDEICYLRVEQMERHDNVRYSAKGIPEAFIRHAYVMFGRSIGSSKELLVESESRPGVKVFAERHSKEAEKVWERLVTLGEAYRNDTAGRFFYPKKEQTAIAEAQDDMAAKQAGQEQRREKTRLV